MSELIKKHVSTLQSAGISSAYHYDIEVFNRWLNGRQVSPRLIAEYFYDRRNLSPATLRKNKSAIKAALKKSMGRTVTLEQLAQINAFFDELKTGKKDVAVNAEKVLTPAEIKRIVNESGVKTGLIIRALFETAARVSELCGIEIKNCRVDKKGVVITILRKRGKIDDVYMSTALFREIRREYAGERYLFEHNGRHISRFTVHRMVKRAGHIIGRPDIHAHTLRHSWATHALEKLGISKVSKYLSHSSPDTTAKYYLHGKAKIEEILEVNNEQNETGKTGKKGNKKRNVKN